MSALVLAWAFVLLVWLCIEKAGGGLFVSSTSMIVLAPRVRGEEGVFCCVCGNRIQGLGIEALHGDDVGRINPFLLLCIPNRGHAKKPRHMNGLSGNFGYQTFEKDFNN